MTFFDESQLDKITYIKLVLHLVMFGPNQEIQALEITQPILHNHVPSFSLWTIWPIVKTHHVDLLGDYIHIRFVFFLLGMNRLAL